jgi:hypothetical protein
LVKQTGQKQREPGERFEQPRSWVYNSETANRRVDATEFVAWPCACWVDPRAALARLLKAV